MSFTTFDPDEYETFSHYSPCMTCGGDLRKCTGACTGSAGYSMVKRTPEQIAKIRADRTHRQEDAILASADAIRARRC